MKKLSEIQHLLGQRKPFLTRKYGVKEIGIFGSYVRGDQREGSDLDILVEFDKPMRIDLIAFIEMENYLTDLLDVKTDLVIREDLKPRLGERILAEVVSRMKDDFLVHLTGRENGITVPWLKGLG